MSTDNRQHSWLRICKVCGKEYKLCNLMRRKIVIGDHTVKTNTHEIACFKKAKAGVTLAEYHSLQPTQVTQCDIPDMGKIVAQHDTGWCPQHGYPLPCAKCGYGLKESVIRSVIDIAVELKRKRSKSYELYEKKSTSREKQEEHYQKALEDLIGELIKILKGN